MNMSSDAPLFSVIIPTRDRPDQFSVALDSVLSQTFRNFELIVVDDGSSEANRIALVETLNKAPGDNCLRSLPRRDKGHGAAFVRNVGIAMVRGTFVCMLDDDDQWIDNAHLQHMANIISERGESVEVLMANQRAYLRGNPVQGEVWLEGLGKILEEKYGSKIGKAWKQVHFSELLEAGGFCHLNTLTVRKDLYDRIGGFDEVLRYEEDRDIFLRLLDHANGLFFSANVVAQHNIPDASKSNNASTALTGQQKALAQVHLLTKSIMTSRKTELVHYSKSQLGFKYKHLAQSAWSEGDRRKSLTFALQGLVLKPTTKWIGFVLLIVLSHLTTWKSKRPEVT